MRGLSQGSIEKQLKGHKRLADKGEMVLCNIYIGSLDVGCETLELDASSALVDALLCESGILTFLYCT